MARPKFAVGMPGIRKIALALTAANLEAFVAGTRKLVMPATGKVVAVTLNVGLLGGTYNIGTVDVLDDGVSILVAAFDVAAAVAGTPINKETTALAAGAASVAKDSVLSIAAAVTTGTSPTWGCATLEIDYVPLGD